MKEACISEESFLESASDAFGNNAITCFVFLYRAANGMPALSFVKARLMHTATKHVIRQACHT